MIARSDAVYGVAVLLLALSLCLVVPAFSQAAASVTLGAEQPAVPQDKAEEIAAASPDALAAKNEHPDLTTISERQDAGNWQVGFLHDDDEIVQVVVDDQSGLVLESWTGHQVAWKMARGYPGAFGRKINAPYVWIPLCLIFVAGLFD